MSHQIFLAGQPLQFGRRGEVGRKAFKRWNFKHFALMQRNERKMRKLPGIACQSIFVKFSSFFFFGMAKYLLYVHLRLGRVILFYGIFHRYSSSFGVWQQICTTRHCVTILFIYMRHTHTHAHMLNSDKRHDNELQLWLFYISFFIVWLYFLFIQQCVFVESTLFTAPTLF